MATFAAKVEIDLSELGPNVDRQDAIEGFVNDALAQRFGPSGDNKVQLNLGRISDRAALRIKNDTGISVTDTRYAIDTDQINKVIKSHGPGAEEPGQVPVVPEVIAVFVDVVENYDRIQSVRGKKTGATITFEKDIDGVVVVVQQIRRVTGTFSLFNMWIRERKN